MLFVSLALLAGSFVSQASVNPTVRFDTSPPLRTLYAGDATDHVAECEDCGLSPAEYAEQAEHAPPPSNLPKGAEVVEQTSQGPRPPAVTIASFDGLGFGFTGPQGDSAGKNPSDNSLAIG